MLKKTLLFLLLNFAALGLGSLVTKNGVASEWYQQLNKAPWTPPGYLFGIAWSVIMICFAVYIAKIITSKTSVRFAIILYIFQWILNTSWNYVFFYYHLDVIGLFVIVSLTLVIFTFLIKYYKVIQFYSLWIAPYLIWLLIATSLNAYIVFMN